MLLLLLLFPILVGLVVFFFGKGRTVTIPEFIVQEVIITIIIASGYYLALSSKSSDTELWNGFIAQKGRLSALFSGCSPKTLVGMMNSSLFTRMRSTHTQT